MNSNYRIEADPERPQSWRIRNLITNTIIAVGLHRDTAVQHVWMLDSGTTGTRAVSVPRWLEWTRANEKRGKALDHS